MSADTWIGIGVGVLATLIIGYLVTWTSGPIAESYKKWRDYQAQKKASESVENARRRVKSLEKELNKLTGYIQNPTTLNAFAFLSITHFMVAMIFALSLGFFFLYGYMKLPLFQDPLITILMYILTACILLYLILIVVDSSNMG